MSNSKKTIIKACDWSGQKRLADYMNDYKVYPALTRKLDAPNLIFDQNTINEIVLWKVARYAELPSTLFKQLGNLKTADLSLGKTVLSELLKIKGVRLPMASTFLRFANPDVFQIFDRHIYRAIYGKLPGSISKDPESCWELYKPFLDDLRKLCLSKEIHFRDSDRILFEFDKRENPSLKSSEQ